MAGFFSQRRTDRRSSALQDLIVLLIALALLSLFLSFGGAHLQGVGTLLARIGADHSSIIVGLLLLNFAVTIYGWRRYRDTSRELVERTAAENRAFEAASTDPLTGFLNRRAFGEAATELLAAAARRRDPVALLIVDVDGFKHVNEVHGHLTGDNLLRCAAEIISRLLPPGGLAARLGADDFAIAFAFDATEAGDVGRVADRLI